MLCKTWKMNSNDYTAYAHKNGLQVAYRQIKGLPDKYTMDGKKHIDLLASKRVFTITTNPMTEAEAAAILADYNAGVVSLTIFDLATGEDITISTEPSTASASVALVKINGTVYYQLSPLAFEEL
jgi:hypothetical protein